MKASLKAMGNVRIVGETSTVVDSIRRIKSRRPDVVIVDIRLPDGSGMDVLQGAPNGTYDPVKIVLTNYPEKPIRVHSMLSGADYFFDKSKDLAKLKEVVKLLAVAEQ